MPEDRRLAAIMFTDIVGYTALMGSDEDRAFELLRKNREMHNQLIEKFNGTLIKEMGDGMLVSFTLSSKAVRCAIEIQKACKEQQIPLRVGIHEGETIFAGTDVFGDGVNISSRLQTDAQEGCIHISESVYRNIKNKTDLKTRFIEEKSFKNVDGQIKIYKILYEGEEADRPSKIGQDLKPKNKYKKYIYFGALVVIIVILVVWELIPLKEKVELEKSIAVLPFDNESADEANAYFVNGMMEDIRNHLSKIGDLRVISKTSTDKYKQTNLTSAEIAEELKVNYLLEGTVQKQGNQVKIHAQLIEAQIDDHIWSDMYTRDLSDVFKVQSEIAKAITEKLEAEITPLAMQILETIPTKNSEAYILYLRGKNFHSNYWISGNQSHIGTAIHFYTRAIELDPQFAHVYGWLGYAIFQESWAKDFYSESYADTLKYFAEKALSINPDLAEAILLLGNFYMQKGEYDKSIPLMEKSIELDPNLADAYFLLGMIYRDKHQYTSAIKNYEKVKKLRIEDLNYYPTILSYLGSLYYYIWDPERAVIEYTELINYNPIQAYLGFLVLHETRGEWDSVKVYVDNICDIDSSEACLEKLSWYHDNTKDFPKALYYFEKAREKKIARGALMFDTRGGGILYDKVNRKGEAKSCFDKQIEFLLEEIRLNTSHARAGFSYFELASVYAYLGEKEKAYQILHEMEKGKFEGWAIEFIQIYYPFESLWEDEEFKEIIQRQDKKAADTRAEIDRLDKEGLL